MMLRECKQAWGGTSTDSKSLQIILAEDVLYIPRDRAVPSVVQDKYWGIFDEEGLLVEGAIYRRGEQLDVVCQVDRLIQPGDNVDRVGGTLLYGGVIHQEYGHFVISTLARLWCYQNVLFEGVNVVFHSHLTVKEIFEIPYMAVLLSAAGVSPKNCIVFERPTTISKLLMPDPSIVEQHSANFAFADFCKYIGSKIADQHGKNSVQGACRGSVVYVSKQNLRNGVRNIVNEDALAVALQAKGVYVIYPESLSFAAQLEVFNNATVVIGFVGSAFHTSVFANSGCNIIGISHIDAVNSNFILIDKIKNNKALYVFGDNCVYQVETQEGFSQSLAFSNPREIAEDIIDIVRSKFNIQCID